MTDHLKSSFYDWRESLLSSKLSATTKLVLLVLHSHMSTKTAVAFPSYKTIADEASLSKRAVISHIGRAVDAGWLAKQTRFHSGEQTSNLYLMVDPSVELEGGELGSLGGELGSLGGCMRFTPVVNEVHPNSQINNQVNNNKEVVEKTPQKGLQNTITEVQLTEIGLSIDDWLMFLDHRRKLKSPMTDLAQDLAYKKLQRFAGQGEPVQQVIEQSVMNGWKGLFKIKIDGGHHFENNKQNPRYASGRANEGLRKLVEEINQ